MKYGSREIDINVWNGEKLGYYIAIDTETEYIKNVEIPEIITCQVYSGKHAYYVPIDRIKEFIDLHDKSIFVFANAPFDLDVLNKCSNWDYFPKVDEGGVFDIQIMYRLHKLATTGVIPFKYNLNLLSKEFLHLELDKNEDIRCNFAQFKNKPIAHIPNDFLEYGAMDVVATYDIFNILLGEIKEKFPSSNVLGHMYQIKGSIALHHIRRNGIGFNLEKAKEFLDTVQSEMKDLSEILATYGWVRGEKGGKKRFNRIIDRAGIELPKTESGDYSSKEKDLIKYRDHYFIFSYLRYITLEKRTTFIRNITTSRVHPRYNLLMNTGRTSCSSPNFQQLPREGSIRSMFCAEDGKTFLITDYSAIELGTLAQVLYSRYGANEMQKRINAGEDLHKYYASVLYNIPVEEVTKGQRQSAKAANFGFPGGLGIHTFIEFAEGYGLKLTEDVAQNMKNQWFNAFPVMRKYLQGEEGFVETLTKRMRANTTYCQEKNTPFQGLAADGAKIALYDLIKVGYKVVGFVHDEIITEVDETKAEELLDLQEHIMVASMKSVVPDVDVAVESTVSKEYCK
tara:strand:+ start:1291 stop:2991 length:1701 start_codon:yes stop_codon:yes gene_type:complete